MSAVDSRTTVGILGGGQLARMTAEAAIRLGIEVRVYQDAPQGPASVIPTVFTGAWDDAQLLRTFVQGCDAVTLDNEWVDLSTIRTLLPEGCRLWPSTDTMDLVRDKTIQKQHAQRMGLPLGLFAICTSADEVQAAAERFGFPVIVKRPVHSYDGYGNRKVNGPQDVESVFSELNANGQVLVEQWVPFVQELAVIVARRPGGQSIAYPVVTTRQREHRCEAVEVPATVSDEVEARAAELAQKAAAAYDCVGVVGVEMFELQDGTVWLNEIAPRPHNTGHYTIDACVTSQFENHLRAVLDLPLGDPSLVCPAAVMVNVLGTRTGPARPDAIAPALEVQGACVHVYGKSEIRPGRKVGHVTVLGDTVHDASARAYEAAGRLKL